MGSSSLPSGLPPPAKPAEKQALAPSAKENGRKRAEPEQAPATKQVRKTAAPPPPTGEDAALKAKLLGQVDKLAHNAYVLDMGSLYLGGWRSVRVQAEVFVLPREAVLGRADAPPDEVTSLRRETTQRLEAGTAGKDDGKRIEWAWVGGKIEPRAGQVVTGDVGGLQASVGFSANAVIGYKMLAPYERALGAAKGLAENLTSKLPTSWQKAVALEPGSAAFLLGRGRLALAAGIGLGKALGKWRDLTFTVAPVSAKISVDKTLDLRLGLVRLGGNRVAVTVSREDASGIDGALVAHAGAMRADEARDETAGRVLDVLPERARKGDWLEQAADYVQADLRMGARSSEAERALTAYILDFDKAGAQEAFEQMLKLDFSIVDTLAEKKQPDATGVTALHLDQTQLQETNELSGKIGQLQLLRSIGRAGVESGSVTTPSGETVRFNRGRLDSGYSGSASNLIKGERNAHHTLVSIEHSDGNTERFYQLDHSVLGDGSTSKRDVLRMLAFAELVGAPHRDIESLRHDEQFLTSFGPTDRHVRLFIDDQGLKALTERDLRDAETVFSQAYQLMDSANVTLWAQMEDAADHLMDRFYDLGRVWDFWSTGKVPPDSSDSARDAREFRELVQRVKEAPTEAARARIFASFGSLMNSDLRAVAAVARLVGPEHVLIDELSIQDTASGQKLQLAREGALVDPTAAIESLGRVP